MACWAIADFRLFSRYWPCSARSLRPVPPTIGGILIPRPASKIQLSRAGETETLCTYISSTLWGAFLIMVFRYQYIGLGSGGPVARVASALF